MGTSDLKNCAAHFLEDEPCRAPSAFQIHEEIAQAIASEIKTGKSGNIALIGNWGSGKSTIVNRVQELLQSESGKDSESGDESTAAKKRLYLLQI
jgi:ABC-type phosphate/phosphonate transport system ATPase subunit